MRFSKLVLITALMVFPFRLLAAEFAHVHLAAPHPEAAATWYQRHFGGTLAGFGGSRYPAAPIDRVVLGETLLIFAQREPDRGSDDSVLSAIAISVDDPATTIAKLQEDGGEILGRPLSAGSTEATEVRDPWGTRILVLDDPDYRGLHHVQISAREPESALAWYQRTLGGQLARYQKSRPGIRFNNGVWLFATEHDQPMPSHGRSIDQLGWNVINLEEAARRLRAHGVDFTMEPRDYRHIRIAFIQGPGGARLELVQQ